MPESKLSVNRTILIVAAHYDDEILGCGGTIAKHISAGDNVHIFFMADGTTSRESGPSREKTAKLIKDFLGIKSITSLGFPDNKMDSLCLLDIVQPLEEVISRLRPEIVYTHHYGDLNIDHQLTHKAVMTAIRPQPGLSVKKILSFETPSSSEWSSPSMGSPFVPNYFVDISKHMEKKIEAFSL